MTPGVLPRGARPLLGARAGLIAEHSPSGRTPREFLDTRSQHSPERRFAEEWSGHLLASTWAAALLSMKIITETRGNTSASAQRADTATFRSSAKSILVIARALDPRERPCFSRVAPSPMRCGARKRAARAPRNLRRPNLSKSQGTTTCARHSRPRRWQSIIPPRQSVSGRGIGGLDATSGLDRK